MKICVSGKGGVGKTTFAATLSRILSKEREVIAIDADPDFNLHNALGIDVGNLTPLSEMKELIRERTGADPDAFGAVFRLNPRVSDLPERIWVEDDNIKFILLGTIKVGGGGCACPANVLLQRFLQNLFLKDYHVVVDMEAGIEHLGRATSKYTDILILIVEPSVNSLQTAQKIQKLALELGIERICVVGNKVMNEMEEEFILERFPNSLGVIPYDPIIRRLELSGGSLTKHKKSKAYKKIVEITEKITKKQ